MRAARCALAAALAAVGLTAACTVDAQMLPTPSPPPPSLTHSGGCGAGGLQGLVGQPESVLAGRRFSQPLRVIPPGQAVTMDYSPARLNIEIDARGRIAAVHCG
jgi:hypothetical protein